MARRKDEVAVKDRYAELISGRKKKLVKAWQYYSIVDFCRGFGRSREDADWIARWCDKAKNGDYLEADEGFKIRIVERECV